MEQKDKSLSGFPISGGIVALALLMGLGLVSQISFEPSRPKHPDYLKERMIGGEDIQARLWQDPFAAIQSHEKRCGQEKPHRKHTPQKFADDMVNKETKELILLGVMVFGGPYAEEAEMRRRYRYAVLSALGRLNYVPEDEMHIGCMATACFRSGDTEVIPYECFYRET